MALVLSVSAHAAWLATPVFMQAWQMPPETTYDAVLMPFANPVPKVDGQPDLVEPRARRLKKPAVARKPVAKPLPPAPESAASFVAPENSIAVERGAEAYGDGDALVVASSEGTPPTVNDTNANSTSISNALTPEPTPPAVAEPVTIAAPPSGPQRDAVPPPELPSRISIAYKLSSSVSDGVANYTWKRDGDKFEIDSTTQATGFIVGNLIGVLHQVSHGVVTPTGLQPIGFRIRRGESLPDSAEFLRASNELKLTRAGDTRLLPLPALIQDMQSFLFQLAFDAPKLRGPDDRLEILVTNARKIYRHRFRQVGTEAVNIRSAPVQTIHLRSEAGDPEDIYEVWLATENYHLPVKIRFFAGRFPIELIAANIRTTP